MMGAVGDVQVGSPLAFTTEDDVRVRHPNTFDPDEALFTRRADPTEVGGLVLDDVSHSC